MENNNIFSKDNIENVINDLFYDKENRFKEISFRRHGSEYLKLPIISMLGVLFIGISKPKLIALITLAIAISGTDIVFIKSNLDEVSVLEELKKKSECLKNMFYEVKENTEYSLSEIKDNLPLKKETERYFTIKL